METERLVWEKCDRELSCYTNIDSSDKTHLCCLKALASVRALIVNSSTSDETISRVLDTLVRILHHDQENIHHHVLKLLSDLALHRDLSHTTIFDTVYAYALGRKDASPLTAEALAVIVTSMERSQSFSKLSSSSELSENLFLLLCSSSSVSVRSWIILNAKRFNVGTCLLVTVFLGFTSDPYPYVRRAALDGLVSLKELANVQKHDLIESCYDRAVELLIDTNECVRSAATRVTIRYDCYPEEAADLPQLKESKVSEWGVVLATLYNEVGDKGWLDAVFIQVCAMVRDTSVEVRTVAFASLGQMKLVSEDLLLQTLSKKITIHFKKRKTIVLCTSKKFDLPASNVAGVFVHGLEDEFSEVRKSTCISLGKLTISYVQFAEEALNLLMDMLNDDITEVRLQCLQTMYHMATLDCLKVQQLHMHMFLSTLVDSNTLIRCATRKVLRLMKLTNLDMFNSAINGLLTNLDSYVEDEADIFNVLFKIGRGHSNFAVNFVKETFDEIEPSCEGELRIDKARVAAILVLAIAASLTHEQHISSILRRVLTYAIPFLGRISYSLRDVMSQDTLFAYLSYCSRFLHSPIAEIFGQEEHCFSVVEDASNPYSKEIIKHVTPLHQVSYGTSEINCQDNSWDPSHTFSSQEYQQKEATHAIGPVLKIVADTWPLIKSGCTDEVCRALRDCKEELATLSVDSDESDAGLLAFAYQYVRSMKLLGKVWMHFYPPRKFIGSRTGLLDLLVEKLDMNLRRMRYGFWGFSVEEELHILEFILLICVLRLSKPDICYRPTILKRLRSTLSCVEHLCQKGSIKPSDFARELNSFCQEESSDDDGLYYAFSSKRLVELFSLQQFVLGEKLKHIKADLSVPDNDSENPLPFIAGFPAAIPFEIWLHNVCSEDRLWLKLTVEEFTQYVFLTFDKHEDNDCLKKVALNVPFYTTPKAASFSLRACIGKECLFDDLQMAKGLGGPKHELTYLCNEKEVYFVTRS
ncbi:Integrator complex subunit [Thalictrum thalictroides]|uniref:Integrator complex subunit n=1 Tax=Thalictrum thalictroides TaxID=46969 RepID=A0A7J6WTR8_THATH|nr:Integrator complex subunit [Thalictrum thalictroides]